MSADAPDRIDQVVNDLDDLKTDVDELAQDPAETANPETVERLKAALEKASDVADDLEDEQES